MSSSAMAIDDPFLFEDYFPSMVERLGTDAFIGELCNGFCLLMDVEKGLITFESLRRNTFVLGLEEMRDEEIVCMLAEGDLDGDGALNQMEFCILMFRLSPGLMDQSKRCMDEMVIDENNHVASLSYVNNLV
ncbi:calcium-binding protein KRP1-like [Actinidia eriantha]|uniref:calcium-binding protein KRP1-like n=1 Tax=Actinidia eriantha TaxID=165200 RepID=UPI00258E6A83|nr:calcium-binding protein KRP1-like [Actinidia eriantha]